MIRLRLIHVYIPFIFNRSLNNYCWQHVCAIHAIATCRLRLQAPLVISNNNNDDDDSFPRILLTDNTQSRAAVVSTITSNNNDDDDDDDDDSLLSEDFVIGIILSQVKPQFSLFLFHMNN